MSLLELSSMQSPSEGVSLSLPSFSTAGGVHLSVRGTAPRRGKLALASKAICLNFFLFSYKTLVKSLTLASSSSIFLLQKCIFLIDTMFFFY